MSTRRIADSVGIAEGTVFRVFPTKEDLLREAVDSYLDPSSFIAEIDAIDPGLPLAEKVHQVLTISLQAATRVRVYMMAMKRNRTPQPASGDQDQRPPFAPGGLPSPHHAFGAQATALHEAIQRVLAPNADEFQVELPTAAAYIMTTGMASFMLTPTAAAIPADTFVHLTLRALTKDRKAQ